MGAGLSRTRATDLGWLLRLRSGVLAVAVVAALVGREVLHLALPMSSLGALALAALFSMVGAWSLRRRPPRWLIPGLLGWDGMLLTGALALTGGIDNPFVLGYLALIALGGALFGRRGTAVATAGALGAMAILFFVALPVHLDHDVHEAHAHEHHHHGHSHTTATTPAEHLQRHLQGSWLGFAASALLIGYLLDRALRRRDETIRQLQDDNRRQQQLAELGAMAAQAAHELGTPLATIAFAADELADELAGHPLEPEAATIRRQVARCRSVLDEMGRRARGEVEAGRAVGVATLIEGASEAPAGAAAAALDVDVVPPSLTVFGPERALRHVLQGLIANARRASPDGATVTVRARAHADRVCLEVCDEGDGVAAAVRARVGHQPLGATASGLGIGLFLSRAVVERVGGHLELVPGDDGTVARLLLPTGDAT
ncbi:MAG: ATP-binding protein [Myxococcota bacterium]